MIFICVHGLVRIIWIFFILHVIFIMFYVLSCEASSRFPRTWVFITISCSCAPISGAERTFYKITFVAKALSLICCPDWTTLVVNDFEETCFWHDSLIRVLSKTTTIGWPIQLVGVSISKNQTTIFLKPEDFVISVAISVGCPDCLLVRINIVVSLLVSVQDNISIILEPKLHWDNGR